jgi:hypothetical protein
MTNPENTGCPLPDDRPLPTQTAAPPTVPPRRPIVETTMADDDARRHELDSILQQLATIAHIAELARLKKLTDDE